MFPTQSLAPNELYFDEGNTYIAIKNSYKPNQGRTVF